MARQTQQSKDATRERILLYLEAVDGATEADLEASLGMERRTINNYLREALAGGLVEKDGTVWSIKASKVIRLIDQLIINLQELRKELNNAP